MLIAGRSGQHQFKFTASVHSDLDGPGFQTYEMHIREAEATELVLTVTRRTSADAARRYVPTARIRMQALRQDDTILDTPPGRRQLLEEEISALASALGTFDPTYHESSEWHAPEERPAVASEEVFPSLQEFRRNPAPKIVVSFYCCS